MSELAASRPKPAIPNGLLGLMFFLMTEAMLFAGLISAFVVIRAGLPFWPPADQPRLPVFMTAINTSVLLMSGAFFFKARRLLLEHDPVRCKRFLGMAALMGTLFLLIQGSEWLKLISFGLTFTSSVYGSLFYLLIGVHGLHVLGGVIALWIVVGKTWQKRYTPDNFVGLEMAFFYWMFVVGIWPILYGLVYFA